MGLIGCTVVRGAVISPRYEPALCYVYPRESGVAREKKSLSNAFQRGSVLSAVGLEPCACHHAVTGVTSLSNSSVLYKYEYLLNSNYMHISSHLLFKRFTKWRFIFPPSICLRYFPHPRVSENFIPRKRTLWLANYLAIGKSVIQLFTLRRTITPICLTDLSWVILKNNNNSYN